MKNRRRISIQIDSEIESIVKINRGEYEAESACLARLIKESADIKLSLNDVKIEAGKHLKDTRDLIAKFLEKTEQPFRDISQRLEAIDERTGARS